jgi:surfeit locus 1 family protein
MKRIIMTVAALGGVLLTCWLGFWQLSRGDEKVGMIKQLDEKSRMSELAVADLSNAMNSPELLNRRIRLKGEWVAQYTVYLANRSHDGKSGFWVMTPLKLEDAKVVMVIRGWSAWNASNPSLIPSNVQTPDGIVEVSGLVANSPSKMLELWGSEDERQESTAKSYLKSDIWQNVDVSQFSRQTGLPIALFVHQLGEPSDGLIRDLPIQGMSPDRNYGYSVQWFLLSALIAVLYLWYQWIKPYLNARKD